MKKGNFVKIHDRAIPSCLEVEMQVTNKNLMFPSNTSKGIGNQYNGTKKSTEILCR